MLAAAQAQATLALSHRTAEQTELAGTVANSGLRVVTGVSG